MLASLTIPKSVLTPLTQTKRRRSPFYSHFLPSSGLSVAFYWAEEPRKWISREKFVILVLTVDSSMFKVEFLSLAIEYLFTEKYWEFLELQTYQATSQAFPGQAVTRAASGSEFYVVVFSVVKLLFPLRSSKLTGTGIRYWILIIVPELKREFSLMEHRS